MYDEDLISIIVPVYNAEEYLSECVHSILEQTHKNLQVILVDDGSTDKSPLLCDEFAKIDNRVQVIHQSNLGVSAARNCALEHVQGKYIGFVDSDDFVEPWMYEKLFKCMTNTNSDIAITGYYSFYNNNKISHVYKTTTLLPYEALKVLIDDRYIRNQLWSMLYKKELFYQVKFPLNKLYEDVRTIYKLFIKAKRICVLDDCLYFYRIINNSLSHTVDFNRGIDLLNAFEEQKNGVLMHYPQLERICVLHEIRYSLGYAFKAKFFGREDGKATYKICMENCKALWCKFYKNYKVQQDLVDRSEFRKLRLKYLFKNMFYFIYFIKQFYVKARMK